MEAASTEVYLVEVQHNDGISVFGLDAFDVFALKARQRVDIHGVTGRQCHLHDDHVAAVSLSSESKTIVDIDTYFYPFNGRRSRSSNIPGTNGQQQVVGVRAFGHARVEREQRPSTGNVHVISVRHLYDGESGAGGRYVHDPGAFR